MKAGTRRGKGKGLTRLKELGAESEGVQGRGERAEVFEVSPAPQRAAA